MTKPLKILSVFLLLVSCSHPDSKGNDRHKGSKISIENTPAYTVEDIHAPKFEEVETSQTIIDMEEANGVKFVWIEINGVRLKFIFDTGASDIFISPAEAKVLVRQGTLEKEDFLGIQNFQDATGGISEGVIVNLKSVKIGDKILYNVKASISDNENSPLLLGQSALERFGRIEIDNVHQRIILKD